MASCNMASAATGFVLSSSSSSTLTLNTNTSPNGIAFPLKNNIDNSSRGIRMLVMRASEEAAPLAATTTTAQAKAAKPPPIRPKRGTKLRQCSSSRFISGWHQMEGNRSRRGSLNKVNALPDWPLMAVLVEHMEGQRDLITHKSVWHLNDETIKSVYTFYIMFTCWGCCFFGSTKDPYYDSEQYRKDGGDGTGHWVYEKQEDIEESARAELWREELIEEIEQKVGGLRELEEAGKEEELVK